MKSMSDTMEQVPTSVLSAERCHLGEGPTYDATTDTAWWFDILEGRLFEARSRQRTDQHPSAWQDGERAGAHRCGAPTDRQRKTVFISARSLDGRMTLHRPLEADNPSNRSNDARVHPSGTFWIGTMGRKAEAGAGAIYALYRGEISLLFPAITIPNAICFSPDGATGYFADTAKNELYRVALDPLTGLPRGTPEVLLRHRGVGGLDGAVVDADGLIWNRALGRRLRRRLQSARRAPALSAGAGAPVELPGLCRAGFLAPAGHVGLAGHG